MSEDKEMRELAHKLGRRGGFNGGKARAEKPAPEQRPEIARKVAKAWWAKKRQQESQ